MLIFINRNFAHINHKFAGFIENYKMNRLKCNVVFFMQVLLPYQIPQINLCDDIFAKQLNLKIMLDILHRQTDWHWVKKLLPHLSFMYVLFFFNYFFRSCVLMCVMGLPGLPGLPGLQLSCQQRQIRCVRDRMIWLYTVCVESRSEWEVA